MMSLDPDRRSAVLGAKLGALARSRWDIGRATPAPFPAGAALAVEGRAWVLLDAGVDTDAHRRLGAAMSWAAKAGAAELHVLVDDPVAAGDLARRASPFALPPIVWQIVGRELKPAVGAPSPTFEAPAPQAELYRPVLKNAGLEAVVERGSLIGEVRGLEVARVVVHTADGPARVDAGVGRFDQEASAMMFADLSETDAVDRAAAIVRRYRRPGAPRHPLNQLAPERWLRWVVVRRPELVGASKLEPVESVLGRRNLTERAVASACGTSSDGQPLVVTCSTGVDLELVPAAADDRLAHAPDARLVVVVPTCDALPATTALAESLAEPAQVVGVDEDWRSLDVLRPSREAW